MVPSLAIADDVNAFFVNFVIVQVIEEGAAQGWWKGSVGERSGMFPGSFAQLLVPNADNPDDPVNVVMEKEVRTFLTTMFFFIPDFSIQCSP